MASTDTPREMLAKAERLAADRRFAEALGACDAALAAGVAIELLTIPWANSLSMVGRYDEALALVDRGLASRPEDFALVNMKGLVLKRAGRLRDALEWLDKARRLRPGQTSVWQNLGNVHGLLGDYAAAAKAFRKLAKLEPRNVEALRLQARALYAGGSSADAVKVLRRLTALSPRMAQAWTLLVLALLRLDDFDGAEAALARARVAMPGHPLPELLAARIALRRGDTDGALALLRAAQAAHPGDHDSGLLLVRLLVERDSADAEAVLDAVAARYPEDSEVRRALLFLHSRARHGDEVEHLERAYAEAIALLDKLAQDRLLFAHDARTVFARLLDLDRFDAVGSHDELLPYWQAEGLAAGVHYELGRVGSLDERLRLVEWHRQWGSRQEAAVTPLPQAPAVHGRRKLRIGFMSSDLRSHPVTYFALPLLEQFDPDQVEIFCYSFYTRQRDQVQALIESRVTAFRWWPSHTDEQAAAGIREDDLDILFELGGTTAMNKLQVMAWRPARIGASWLGYPHSAGLSRIDYILMDPHTLPTDPRLLVEAPFMMPETWVVLSRLGFSAIPIEPDLPEQRRGALTFGTANNPYKFTRACLDGWAAVLRRVPGSRFLFLRPEAATASFRRNASAAFAERDVDPDRLDFVGVRGTHMPHYNSIDIALDSFPHVGGTTTCEALWMGVPTVTLAGPGFCERLAHSNVVNAGLGDLSAGSFDQYVEIAAALAEDRSRRTRLRHGLRDQIRAHPLGQQQRFVDAFYARCAEVTR